MVPATTLEGPFLNATEGYAGCFHPQDAMRSPDIGLLERLDRLLSRPVLLVTIAPELPGSESFIRVMAARVAPSPSGIPPPTSKRSLEPQRRSPHVDPSREWPPAALAQGRQPAFRAIGGRPPRGELHR